MRASMLLVLAVLGCCSASCVCPHNFETPMAERPCPPLAGCRGGKVVDACACCWDCAKVLGETCGGFSGEDGSCDAGLICHHTATEVHQGANTTEGEVTTAAPIEIGSVGICKLE